MLNKLLRELKSINTELKPYRGEHACRINSPGKYDKIRRQNNWRKHDGKRIDAIWGVLTDGTTELQAIRMPVSDWTSGAAKTYCEDQGGRFDEAMGEE